MNKHQLFIQNRMKELGIENYHCQSLKFDIEAGQNIQYVKAYNEYLFLVSEHIPGDLILQSDTNIFFSAQAQNTNAIPEEFSGLLSIEYSSIDPFTLEFIQVIPNS